MNHFTMFDLSLRGLKLIKREQLRDSRGYLSRIFCNEALTKAGWTKPIAQINHTFTSQCGTVRGMHFQFSPYMEMKLVSCMKGKIWDVAVDLRADSPTFLQWHAEILSAENNAALLIPEGFAHGFQSLVDDIELLYCHTNTYHADAEGGVNPQDPKLGISWPLNISDISERDQSHLLLDSKFKGVKIL